MKLPNKIRVGGTEIEVSIEERLGGKLGTTSLAECNISIADKFDSEGIERVQHPNGKVKIHLS